jgi:hypothetical protein
MKSRFVIWMERVSRFVRVHKGRPQCSSHFETLSDDPSDRFVWATTLSSLTNAEEWKSDQTWLFNMLGFEPCFIETKKKDGFVFSILEFDREPDSAVRATWSGAKFVWLR